MSKKIRRSIIAGSWYPGTPGALRSTLEGYFNNVEPTTLDGELVGLIAPHAGYMYSGQTAAYAYKQLEGKSYPIVVILSPLHRLWGAGPFVTTSADAYETPLGQVPVNTALVDALDRRIGLNRVFHDDEHSLEIQLPFLQYILGEFTLVPVMIGAPDVTAARELAPALAEVIQEEAQDNTLIVASTDLHHITDYNEVVRRDKVVVEAIASYDLTRIERVLSPPDCSVCGRVGVVAMLRAARTLGADRVRILHHTNSGDVTGIRVPGQYTVGYLAAAVYK